MATQAQRRHLHDLMKYLLHKEPQVHYPWHDIRTGADRATFGLTEQQMEHLLEHGGTIQFDCSQSVTQLCRWAGLKSPNGNAYRDPGYTGTLLANLPHYSNAKVAQIGALCVYGGGTGHHVSMVYEPDAKHGNPLMWSHGREAGPLLVRLNDQKTQQPSPATFLSIAHL